MNISPIEVLRDAQKSVPAVKYAAGIAGVAAVVAIIAGFQLDYRIAVFGTIIVLGLMFVLVTLSSFASHSGPSVVKLATFGAWSFLLLTIAVSILLIASYFFSWPRQLESYIVSQPPNDENEPSETRVSPAHGYVKMSSEQGDYIGQGLDYELSDENGTFSVRGDHNSISISFEGDDHWSFDFSAPENKNLSVGIYSSAQRDAFHNPVKPGIDISGAGRGCNEISGRFEIENIVFSEEQTLERFVAEFEQHCEGSDPMLKGEINVWSDN